jgi:hypothetical protein
MICGAGHLEHIGSRQHVNLPDPAGVRPITVGVIRNDLDGPSNITGLDGVG